MRRGLIVLLVVASVGLVLANRCVQGDPVGEGYPYGDPGVVDPGPPVPVAPPFYSPDHSMDGSAPVPDSYRLYAFSCQCSEDGRRAYLDDDDMDRLTRDQLILLGAFSGVEFRGQAGVKWWQDWCRAVVDELGMKPIPRKGG